MPAWLRRCGCRRGGGRVGRTGGTLGVGPRFPEPSPQAGGDAVPAGARVRGGRRAAEGRRQRAGGSERASRSGGNGAERAPPFPAATAIGRASPQERVESMTPAAPARVFPAPSRSRGRGRNWRQPRHEPTKCARIESRNGRLCGNRRLRRFCSMIELFRRRRISPGSLKAYPAASQVAQRRSSVEGLVAGCILAKDRGPPRDHPVCFCSLMQAQGDR